MRRHRSSSRLDEYTRECLALPAARSMSGADVVTALQQLVATRGAPEYPRSDNGPEFIARPVREWLASAQIATPSIEPGRP